MPASDVSLGPRRVAVGGGQNCLMQGSLDIGRIRENPFVLHTTQKGPMFPVRLQTK